MGARCQGNGSGVIATMARPRHASRVSLRARSLMPMKLSFSALLKRRPIWRFTRSRNGLRPRAGSRPARRRSGAFSINAASRLKKTAHAAEQERADVARRRRYWRNWQTWLRPERLVFIDETGAKTNMARRRGRAPKGQRLPAAIPWGHWQTTTFVAGLRTTGLTAPMVIEGAMDGDAFKAYVKQLLAPSLKPRDIVIMDNLSSHKVAGVREAIKGRRHPCFTCRLTRPTSTPSNWRSQNSRPCSEKPPPDRSKTSSKPSPRPSTSSHLKNAPTSSNMPDMATDKLK